MRVLVTGGAGYIGSHTILTLLERGDDVIVVDNFANSSPVALDRVARIAGRSLRLHRLDVADEDALDAVFATERPEAVIHFAGLKAVGESVREPLRYYDNNVGGTLALLAAMRAADVRTFVFSSSATVYGDPDSSPIREDFAMRPANPYGFGKYMAEQVLADLDRSEPGRWRIARLRYFNPVGAHESGLIGEDPEGVPNNLMPYVAQVAAGQRPELAVFGGDYPTPDGTGLRDYIHVSDLAEGHVAALRHLREHAGVLTVNLGSGEPVSVLQMVQSFERACGHAVPYKIVDRRPGDVAAYWADSSTASRLLGWTATRDVDQMCADVWRWQNGEARLVK